jgi:hypothetical protein
MSCPVIAGKEASSAIVGQTWLVVLFGHSDVVQDRKGICTVCFTALALIDLIRSRERDTGNPRLTSQGGYA